MIFEVTILVQTKYDLTLAIVTYNNENLITKTVASLVNNIPAKFKYKLFIVDNNSTDSTLSLVENLAANIEIVRLEVNNGFSYGHNTILEHINSRYHLVINPDILIEDTIQIEKMIDFLDKNQNIGMLSPLILNTDYSIQHLCKTNPTVFDMAIRRLSPNLFKKRQNKYVMLETGYNKIMNIEYASGSFMVFRTDIFKQLKGFDDSFFMYLEDADITRRVNEISNAVFFPEARVIHEWERSGHKDIKFAWITLKSMNVYFKKWGWKWF